MTKAPALFPEFSHRHVDVGQNVINLRMGGDGPPVLLLHGFPETHLMWREIAPALGARFTVVCADLRGYGDSGCPPSTADHMPYSKRAMASEMTVLMRSLGFSRFAIVGHDRGGRVAYRMALDHPDVVTKLAALDVVPISAAWDMADDRLALGFWPWSLLAQPAPLPEAMLTAAASSVIQNAIYQWGSPADCFPTTVVNAYTMMLSDPQRAHAICEEYRAAAGVDREHDLDDLDCRRQIGCEALLLWSASGPLGSWYVHQGGPIGMWRPWAPRIRGHAIDGGHFFPEERPFETAKALATFLDEAI